MSEKFTAVESPPDCTDRRGRLASVRCRLVDGLAALSVPQQVAAALSVPRRLSAALSVTRLGAVVLALSVVYFALVVPADFALLLSATLFVVGLAAMVPLAAVAAVVWVLE